MLTREDLSIKAHYQTRLLELVEGGLTSVGIERINRDDVLLLEDDGVVYLSSVQAGVRDSVKIDKKSYTEINQMMQEINRTSEVDYKDCWIPTTYEIEPTNRGYIQRCELSHILEPYFIREEKQISGMTYFSRLRNEPQEIRAEFEVSAEGSELYTINIYSSEGRISLLEEKARVVWDRLVHTQTERDKYLAFYSWLRTLETGDIELRNMLEEHGRLIADEG